MSKIDKNKTTSDEAEAELREIEIGGGEETAEGEATGDEAVEAADPVAELQARVKELEERNLRTLADFDNFRKRSLRQVDDLVRSANDQILLQLLEVVDNFERALDQEVEISQDHHKALTAFRQGVELIYNQLKGVLERNNVTPIEALGRPFDTNYHEALMQLDSDEYDDGIVASEISRGYMIEDRVLRHAQVGVSRGPAKDKDE